jgi:CTP:molybdopterin cytidylyltransferase MocA
VIAGVLLASGASRRFGADKLVAPLGGRPVVRWSAEALAHAVDACHVVVRQDAERVREALSGLDVRRPRARDVHEREIVAERLQHRPGAAVAAQREE